MIKKEDGCQAVVVRDNRGWSYQCTNKPKIERDGRLYCKIHDPLYIQEKQRKWREKFDEEFKKEQTRQTLRAARTRATEGLTLEELAQVTPEKIRKMLDDA